MTDAKRRRCLLAGATVLGIGVLGLGAPSFVMLAQRPDVATRPGRLLVAGALANLALAFVLSVVALIPLRRGERWAYWVFLLPVLIYGLPMVVIDGTHVVKEHLLVTLAPQVSGLAVIVAGMTLAGLGIFRGQVSRDVH
jgi:hypothetical protein